MIKVRISREDLMSGDFDQSEIIENYSDPRDHPSPLKVFANLLADMIKLQDKPFDY